MQRTEGSHDGKWDALSEGLGFTARRAATYLTDWIVLFSILAPSGFLVGRLIGASRPQTGPELWQTILLTFSAPAWLYFILSDRSAGGATLGKRIFRLRVTSITEERISLARAVSRTAIKLLPWELAHFFIFALSEDFSELNRVQWMGVSVVYALILVYLLIMLATGGKRTVHDFAAGTDVRQMS